jgi:hypothetical protein
MAKKAITDSGIMTILIFLLAVFALAILVFAFFALKRPLLALAKGYISKEGRRGPFIPQLVVIAMILWTLTSDRSYGYAYHQLLDTIICTTCAFLSVFAYKGRQMEWIWAFGLLAIIHNPFFRFKLSWEIWTNVGVATTVVLFVSIFLLRRLRTQPEQVQVNNEPSLNNDTTNTLEGEVLSKLPSSESQFSEPINICEHKEGHFQCDTSQIKTGAKRKGESKRFVYTEDMQSSHKQKSSLVFKQFFTQNAPQKQVAAPDKYARIILAVILNAGVLFIYVLIKNALYANQHPQLFSLLAIGTLFGLFALIWKTIVYPEWAKDYLPIKFSFSSLSISDRLQLLIATTILGICYGGILADIFSRGEVENPFIYFFRFIFVSSHTLLFILSPRWLLLWLKWELLCKILGWLGVIGAIASLVLYLSTGILMS